MLERIMPKYAKIKKTIQNESEEEKSDKEKEEDD